MTKNVLELVKIQYPTNEVVSLQRSITQIKELLEDPEFYKLISDLSRVALPDMPDKAVTFHTTATELVLTDTYQPIPTNSPVPPRPTGTYQVTANIKFTSTGGNSTFQIRITEDGAPLIEGPENSLSNGVIAYVPITFITTSANGALSIQATGNNVTVNSGVLVLVRVGQ